jgi:hypothetical protein
MTEFFVVWSEAGTTALFRGGFLEVSHIPPQMPVVYKNLRDSAFIFLSFW